MTAKLDKPSGRGGGGTGITVTEDAFLSGIAGVPCARLGLAEPGQPPTAAEMRRFLAGAGFRFASIRLPATAPAIIKAMTAAGFRPIETLITFRHELAGPLPEVPDGITWAENVPRDSETAAQVAEIGRLAFHADRFHSDPMVPARIADRLKEEWARNNLCGRALHSALALADNGRVGGFCEITRSGDWRAIDLIAVHPDCRRRGYARAMVAACLARTAAERPGGKLLVGTAAANQASVSLYESMGFVEMRRDVTLHWAAGPL